MIVPNRLFLALAFFFLALASGCGAFSFSPESWTAAACRNNMRTALRTTASSEPDGSHDDEAERLKQQAERLRQQIRDMEASLDEDRQRQRQRSPTFAQEKEEENAEKTLRGKRILVAGANGRLGSMVCRYLLRNHPQTEVVAAVHYVGENSPTARGYGRLSYEVGAEEGIGTLGPAWSSDDERNASFQWHEGMREYNLRNLRIVECEFLDPVQCSSVVEGCDAVIWCATDFNGNRPRAISGLNIAFLFRAVAVTDKGRVEVEGLQNMLSALKRERQEALRRKGRVAPPANDPINFVLVSTAPEAFADFETPFGSFIGIKRQGEQVLKNDFPSVTSTVLQMGRYEDTFVGEDLDVIMRNEQEENTGKMRLINRRDAARAAVDALTKDKLNGQTVQVWTALR